MVKPVTHVAYLILMKDVSGYYMICIRYNVCFAVYIPFSWNILNVTRHCDRSMEFVIFGDKYEL